MKRSLRKTKSELKEYISKRKLERDGAGRVIINMNVKDDSDFLSVFSESETPVISNDVADFIENSTHALAPEESITLKIHSDCIDDKEKEDYQKAIREYYFEKYIANERELKRNFFIILILGIAGIMFLALAISLNAEIWSEVIDIVAWVLLWEAVDFLVFKNREHLENRKRYLSYIAMNIEYLDI